MSTSIPVRCTRCRNEHEESDRVSKPCKSIKGAMNLVCPCCGCTSYFDMRPMVAWCWASGLIEMGEELPENGPNGGGAIEIARGPKAPLKQKLAALARHGRGQSAGKLLVPGVPEASSQKEKGDALAAWLKFCGKGRATPGIAFSRSCS